MNFGLRCDFVGADRSGESVCSEEHDDAGQQVDEESIRGKSALVNRWMKKASEVSQHWPTGG